MSHPPRLLFICSGNICRSPMAEGLVVPNADRRGLDVHARSAGTLGLVDRPADPKAVKVCREVGVDISDHRSQPITEDLIRWADWVLVMELAHAAHVREFYPVGEDRVLLLGQFAGTLEIDDPIGGWTFRFRRSRKLIERALEGFVEHLGRR